LLPNYNEFFDAMHSQGLAQSSEEHLLELLRADFIALKEPMMVIHVGMGLVGVGTEEEHRLLYLGGNLTKRDSPSPSNAFQPSSSVISVQPKSSLSLTLNVPWVQAQGSSVS
jgi:hypothetical protein